jgi:hypothetical protein
LKNERENRENENSNPPFRHSLSGKKKNKLLYLIEASEAWRHRNEIKVESRRLTQVSRRVVHTVPGESGKFCREGGKTKTGKNSAMESVGRTRTRTRTRTKTRTRTRTGDKRTAAVGGRSIDGESGQFGVHLVVGHPEQEHKEEKEKLKGGKNEAGRKAKNRLGVVTASEVGVGRQITARANRLLAVALRVRERRKEEKEKTATVKQVLTGGREREKEQ